MFSFGKRVISWKTYGWMKNVSFFVKFSRINTYSFATLSRTHSRVLLLAFQQGLSVSPSAPSHAKSVGFVDFSETCRLISPLGSWTIGSQVLRWTWLRFMKWVLFFVQQPFAVKLFLLKLFQLGKTWLDNPGCLSPWEALGLRLILCCQLGFDGCQHWIQVSAKYHQNKLLCFSLQGGNWLGWEGCCEG